MWNPFKQNKQLKELQALSATFAILDEFARRGILHYHRSKVSDSSAVGSLLIEESLATIKLAEGAEGFKHFLEQVAQWQNFKLLQEAYEAHRINIEAKAVREAKSSLPAGEGGGRGLTKADIQRIRQNARDNMEPLDPENLPSLLTGGSGFDLFIIRATAISAEEALKEASPRGGQEGVLLALGHWDGKKLEMAMYDDIKHNLQK